MKKYLGFIPLIVILVIQMYDTDDKYLWVQLMVLGIGLVIAMIYLYNKNKK